MKDLSNPIVKQKLEIDSELFTQLQGLGIVSELNELSELCGKNSTYFSCMRIRGYSAHVGSLAFLASRLAAKLEREKCVRERAKLRTALEAVNRAITEKCRLREIELHA